MADRLSNLIQGIHNGQISIEEAQGTLSFLAWQEEEKQNRNQLKIKKRNSLLSLDDYILRHGLSPEQFVLERERLNEIIDMVDYIFSFLNKEERKIIWMYAIECKTQQQISDKLNIPQQTISYKLNRIITKISETLVKNNKNRDILCKDNLYPPQSKLEADTPNSLGYPFEFMMKQNNGGRWGKHNGRRTYISKEICMLPEYFTEVFGENHNVVCPLCENCIRKDFNNHKMNKEPL